MNTFARILLAAAITNAPAIAWACPPQRQVVRKQAVVVQQHVPFVQQQQIYTAPLYPQQQVFLKQVQPYAYYNVGDEVRTEAIVERVARLLEQRLQAKLKAGEQSTVHPGAAIMAAKCASCHREGAKAVADKAAPVLFDASQKWIGTRDQAVTSQSLAKRGAMPPQPAKQLDDDEFLAVKSYLDRISSRKDETE